MHRLTLFGKFVEELRKSVTDIGGRRFKKSDLVYFITGQSDASQASRYLRVFDEEKGTFWYHKSTIARMIASAGQGTTDESGLIRRKSRGGFEFIGSPESAVSVRGLQRAIDTLWEESDGCLVLREALERARLTADSQLCQSMYEAYVDEYGTNDLMPCMVATCEGVSAANMVREVYKTLLVSILLGPPATAMMQGSNAVTPRGLGGGYTKVMDGFSLIQLVEGEGGMLLPANDLGFECGSQVTIGRDPREDVAYVPLRAPGAVSYVSGLHARIEQTADETAWVLHNLSTSNGTTVYHTSDGTVRFMRSADEVEELHPGDELWLAPLPAGVGSNPSYDKGAVLRFEHLYKYVVE